MAKRRKQEKTLESASCLNFTLSTDIDAPVADLALLVVALIKGAAPQTDEEVAFDYLYPMFLDGRFTEIEALAAGSLISRISSLEYNSLQ